MSRVDRPQLGWKEPPEWNLFLERIEAEYGATEPYAGVVLEQRWREYRQYHRTEEYANRLLDAVARRCPDTREKTPSTRPAMGNPGGRVWIVMSAKVKAEIDAYATEIGKANHHVLRALVCWDLAGGLLGLLTGKLEVAVPEAETQLAGLDPSDDRGLTAEEKKRRWLANHLTPGAFTREEFGEKLEAMPWRGGDTEHMHEMHLQPVLTRIGYSEHPNNTDLFVPEDQAREYAEEQDIDLNAPAFERKPYDDLTDAERVHKLCVKLARRAEQKTGQFAGKADLKPDAVRDKVFGRTPSKRKVKDLMDRAARAEGFETDTKGGTKRLRCEIEAVEDLDVLADAGLTAYTPPRKAGETDTTPRLDAEKTGVNGHEMDAKEEMDRIMSAKVVASDGEDAE